MLKVVVRMSPRLSFAGEDLSWDFMSLPYLLCIKKSRRQKEEGKHQIKWKAKEVTHQVGERM